MKDLLSVFLPIAILAVAILTFKLWLFGSLAVSAVKSISDSCGKEYPVEIYVINGNWFCSSKK